MNLNTKNAEHYFVVCIDNSDYPVALEKRKIYELIPDPGAEKHNQVRIIDESGEDYLYPANCFIPINLSKGVENAILRVA